MVNRLLLLLFLLSGLCYPLAATAATPDQVAGAIQRSKKWLYDHQANGNWEIVQQPDPKALGNDIRGTQFTGQTAFCAWALVCAGDNASEPHVAAAIDFLKKAPPTSGVYALSTRCLLWSSINLDASTRAIASKDLQALLRARRSIGASKGMYFYTAPVDARDVAYDHSVSQFAILAVWAMEQKGFEIPTSFWTTADQAWRNHQRPDGGWQYMVEHGNPDHTKVTPQMTAAGVATLMITAAQARGPGTNCDPPAADRNVKAGMDWITRNFERIFDRGAEAFGGGYQTYTLFGISRIGTASGLSHFGNTDWYERGTDFLVKTQAPDGAWSGGWLTGQPAATSFGLLFLAYGSAPVVVNKLRYAGEIAPGKPAEVWNARPRDMFNLTRWLSADGERRVNWQVAELAGQTPAQLLEAPVLFIAGSKPLSFSDQETAMLKEFVYRGGLIVGNPDCLSEDFTKSFIKLGQVISPQNEFRVLPDDHPINARQTYLVKQFKKKVPLKGLSNGVRELMIIPALDISRPLNLNDVSSARESFQTWSNILQYATDKSSLKQKGVSHVVRVDSKVKPTRTVRIARIRYAGNWDPEPGGWLQLGGNLRNRDRVELKAESVELGEGKLREYKLAHLTGTETFAFTDAQRAELKAFIDGGGTLVIDAAGGQSAFAAGVEEELQRMFGSTSNVLKALPSDHELYKAGGTTGGNVGYRSFSRERLPGGRKDPNLQVIYKDDRPAVIYSREDLSGGIVGQNVDGIYGYDPSSATAVMRSILLYVHRP